MPSLFKREAKILIGSREFACPPFAMEFETSFKTGSISSTTAKLYNPAPDTIKACEAKPQGQTKLFPKCIITAGYALAKGTCVIGEIYEFKVSQNGPTRTLEMKISDATGKWANAIINQTYRNIGAVPLIRAMLGKIGMSAGPIELGTNKIYPVITVGAFADSVIRICKDTNSEFFFRDGLFHTQSRNRTAKKAFLLNKNTGLLGKPEKTARGWKVQTLFLHSLGAGSTVKVESESANFVGNVVEGKKKFSTNSDAKCEFEAVPV